MIESPWSASYAEYNGPVDNAQLMVEVGLHLGLIVKLAEVPLTDKLPLQGQIAVNKASMGFLLGKMTRIFYSSTLESPVTTPVDLFREAFGEYTFEHMVNHYLKYPFSMSDLDDLAMLAPEGMAALNSVMVDFTTLHGFPLDPQPASERHRIGLDWFNNLEGLIADCYVIYKQHIMPVFKMIFESELSGPEGEWMISAIINNFNSSIEPMFKLEGIVLPELTDEDKIDTVIDRQIVMMFQNLMLEMILSKGTLSTYHPAFTAIETNILTNNTLNQPLDGTVSSVFASVFYGISRVTDFANTISTLGTFDTDNLFIIASITNNNWLLDLHTETINTYAHGLILGKAIRNYPDIPCAVVSAEFTSPTEFSFKVLRGWRESTDGSVYDPAVSCQVQTSVEYPFTPSTVLGPIHTVEFTTPIEDGHDTIYTTDTITINHPDALTREALYWRCRTVYQSGATSTWLYGFISKNLI